LLSEALQFSRFLWRPDRFGVDGYWSLNLVSHEGRETDFQSTPMRGTRALERCPYIRQLLAALDAPWSEVRLRRLEGGRQIPEHYDNHYFWHSRLRLHVPVATDPSVRFYVEEQAVSMGAGECWLFDRQRVHHVENGSPGDRIHLVMDTVGSR